MMTQPAKGHSLVRTSPMGEKFIGTCPQCGMKGLTFADLGDECPNQRGVSCEDVLLEVLEQPTHKEGE